MIEHHSDKTQTCDAALALDVSAYLDGELSEAASALFEAHAKVCAACSAALFEQRRLLAVLNAAFVGEPWHAGDAAIALPKNFAQIVTARAQTDMSGLRIRSERIRAIRLCVVLAALCVFALLVGATAYSGIDGLFHSLRAFGQATQSVLGVAGRAVTDASAGGAVVLRALGGSFVSQSGPVAFVAWAIFACALLMLLRLIGNYRGGARVSE